METVVALVIALVVLCAIVAGQWLLIWRLLDRLLISKSIPGLGPVRSTAPDAPAERPRPKPIMTVAIPD